MVYNISLRTFLIKSRHEQECSYATIDARIVVHKWNWARYYIHNENYLSYWADKVEFLKVWVNSRARELHGIWLVIELGQGIKPTNTATKFYDDPLKNKTKTECTILIWAISAK